MKPSPATVIACLIGLAALASIALYTVASQTTVLTASPASPFLKRTSTQHNPGEESREGKFTHGSDTALTPEEHLHTKTTARCEPEIRTPNACITLLGIFGRRHWGWYADEFDRQRTGYVLERNANGQSASWENPTTGSAYIVTPIQSYINGNSHYCRAFNVEVTIQGGTRMGSSTACRHSNSSWLLMSTRLVQFSSSRAEA